MTTTTSTTPRRSKLARRAAALVLATGIVGAGVAATATPASARANVYSAKCANGVCGIYRNGEQIGIYAVASGRTVWF